MELSKAAPEDAIFVTDVGWNKNGAGQQLQTLRPQSFLTSGGLATMGFAPAAAIGAKLGAPDRKVICLVGDGGLMSVIGALTTAVELNVPVLWVLFNNFCFSTIRTVGTHVFQEHVRHRVHEARRHAVQPGLHAARQGVRHRVRAGRGARRAGRRRWRRRSPRTCRICSKSGRAATCPMPRTGYWDIADFLRVGND